MTALRKSVVLVGFISLIAAGSAFGSVQNIYITQNGSPSGNCTTGVQTLAFLANSANWGAGSSQIGPGTTVLLCGTFNIAAGGLGVAVLGSGSAGGGYVTINFDTNATIQATYLGGSDLFSGGCGPSSACRAGIQIYGQNYVIVDGQNTGIIQNTANGTNLSNHQTSLGVLVHAADHVIVRNLIIQHIYDNAGNSPSSTDTNGAGTADIRVDGPSTNIAVYNNKLTHARIGISSDTASTTGPNSCPTPTGVTGLNPSAPAPTGDWGICYYNNLVSEHSWQILTTGQGAVNVFANEAGDVGSLSGWLNWQWPTSTYHQDGIDFCWGDSSFVLTCYVYNNYDHGDLGQGSPSAHLYCATNDQSGAGASGCTLIAFNNVIVQTGSAQWPNDANNDQITAVDLSGTQVGGGVTLYNNTMVGGQYDIEIYNSSANNPVPFTLKNNIWMPAIPGTSTGWFIHQENNSTWASSVTASNNLYYNGNANPWALNSTNYKTLAAWQAACSCDSSQSLVSNPNLSSSYAPQAGSPAIGIGANLSSLGITALNADRAALARPGGSAVWGAGAYESSAAGGVPPPPAGLTAAVQ